EDVRILRDAIRQYDEAQPTRNGPDVQLEVLLFIALGRPVQGPHRASLRIRLIEIRVLGNCPPRSRRKDPHYVVAEAEGMACRTRAPSAVGHPARNRRTRQSRRIEFTD